MSKRRNVANSSAVKALKKQLAEQRDWIGENYRRDLDNARRTIRDLERRVQSESDPSHSAFRLAIRDMRHSAGHFSFGDIFSLQVSFSPREIEYALIQSQRDVYNLSSIIHLHCRQLADQCEQKIIEHLTTKGMLPEYGCRSSRPKEAAR